MTKYVQEIDAAINNLRESGAAANSQLRAAEALYTTKATSIQLLDNDSNASRSNSNNLDAFKTAIESAKATLSAIDSFRLRK